jgi:hypothetical protein
VSQVAWRKKISLPANAHSFAPSQITFFSMLFVNGRQSGGGFLSQLGCLIVGGLLMVGAFYFLSWLYKALWYASPVLVIAALVINWRVVAATGEGLLLRLRNNPISGILGGVLAFFMFPLLALYWVLAALATRRVARFRSQFERQFSEEFGAPRAGQVPPQPTSQRRDNDDDYVDYEEVK